MKKYVIIILITIGFYTTGFGQTSKTGHKPASAKKADPTLDVISDKNFKAILLKLDVNHDSMITANELPITDGDYKKAKAKRNKDGNYFLPVDSAVKYFSNGTITVTFEGQWDKAEEVSNAVDLNHDGIIEVEEVNLSPQMIKYLADDGKTTVTPGNLAYSFAWGVLILGHKLVYIPAKDDPRTLPKTEK